MRHFTSICIDQCQNGSSNILVQYQEQPRSTRIVVAYPRPAFLATKWQITLQSVLINRSKFVKATHNNTEMGKFKYQGPRRCLLTLVGRKNIVVRDKLFPQKPPGSRPIFLSRGVGSAVPPRVAPPIFHSWSDSGAYSQAPVLAPAFCGDTVRQFGVTTVSTNGLACGFN